MKIILSLFLLLFTFSIKAQIVSIPDPVFKQALLDHGFLTGIEIDTNFDGQIQVAETEALTGLLDVNGQFINIQDLTGIEAFVNITELYVWLNQLTSLDLSSNTLLQILCCQDNQLTFLNISQCVALELLAVGNNQLISLDVSTNLNLQLLSCSNNQLLNLDVRNGNNTNITFFNSGGNPNLTCIFVDDAVYSEENWLKDPTSTFVETQAECDALGVNENILQKINIYPNPVKELLYIEKHDLQFTYLDLQIIDIRGKIVLQSKIVNLLPIAIGTTINLSHLPTGIYFLKLQNNATTILTKKIIKL